MEASTSALHVTYEATWPRLTDSCDPIILRLKDLADMPCCDVGLRAACQLEFIRDHGSRVIDIIFLDYLA